MIPSSDVANKHKITEFVCLAMDTSTGRQLGRFARFVRVLPTAPPPAVAEAAPLLTPQEMAQPNLPPQQLPQPPHQLPQPPRQLLPGGGVPPPEGEVSADGAAMHPPVPGVENPLSSAVPLPDLLQELQQWMASLGLNPGARDAVGFSELGNFRWDDLLGSWGFLLLCFVLLRVCGRSWRCRFVRARFQATFGGADRVRQGGGFSWR